MESLRIALNHGQSAFVDLADRDLMSPYDWRAMKNVDGSWRAVTYTGSGHGLYMHRLIMGAKRGQLVDHEDRDQLNNRRLNLRFATKRQNAQNSVRKIEGKTSRYKGVSFKPDAVKHCPWRAVIKVAAKQIYLGYHRTEDAAARAYDAAARLYFGAFALTNFKETA